MLVGVKGPEKIEDIIAIKKIPIMLFFNWRYFLLESLLVDIMLFHSDFYYLLKCPEVCLRPKDAILDTHYQRNYMHQMEKAIPKFIQNI